MDCRAVPMYAQMFPDDTPTRHTWPPPLDSREFTRILLSPVQEQRIEREKDGLYGQQRLVPGLKERLAPTVFADPWFQHVDSTPTLHVEARPSEQGPQAHNDRFGGDTSLHNVGHLLRPQLFTTAMATIAETTAVSPGGTDTQRHPDHIAGRATGVSTIGPLRRAFGSIGTELMSVLTRAAEQGAPKFDPEVASNVSELLGKLRTSRDEDGRDQVHPPNVMILSSGHQDSSPGGSTDVSPRPQTTPFASFTGSGDAVWYETSSGTSLSHPPPTILPQPSQLYLHTNTTNDGLQLWFCKHEGEWESVPVVFYDCYLPDRVVEGIVHTKFADRMLKLRANGKLSWVTKQSCSTIKSRRPKKRG